MFSCIRQSCSFPKKILIFYSIPSLKFVRAFSSVSCLLRGNANELICKKFNYPKQIHHRQFSLPNISSCYESLGASEVYKVCRNILISTHDITGLSWSLIIIAASVFMKLFISIPCGIYQQYLMSKLELIKVEINNVMNSLKEKILLESYQKQWTKAKLESVMNGKAREHWKYLVIKNNCHPFKITILFFAQLPVWILLTFSIRKMAMDDKRNQFVGGPFWSRNLALPDPVYILPTINFLSSMACVELNALTETPEKIVKNSFRFYIKKIHLYFGRSLSVALFFVSAAVPSAVSLFWTSNSLLALAQKLLIMSPRTRRLFKIPKTPSEIDKPYSHIWNAFLEKLAKLFFKK